MYTNIKEYRAHELVTKGYYISNALLEYACIHYSERTNGLYVALGCNFEAGGHGLLLADYRVDCALSRYLRLLMDICGIDKDHANVLEAVKGRACRVVCKKKRSLFCHDYIGIGHLIYDVFYLAEDIFSVGAAGKINAGDPGAGEEGGAA